VPAYGWFANGLGGWLDERIGPGSRLDELLAPRPREGIVRAARSGDRKAAEQAWSLVILGAWLDRWA
jgi:hypothetical protein